MCSFFVDLFNHWFIHSWIYISMGSWIFIMYFGNSVLHYFVSQIVSALAIAFFQLVPMSLWHTPIIPWCVCMHFLIFWQSIFCKYKELREHSKCSQFETHIYQIFKICQSPDPISGKKFCPAENGAKEKKVGRTFFILPDKDSLLDQNLVRLL